jgi:tripartite-type tricarboxylate transporter receptor subunit TctC
MLRLRRLALAVVAALPLVPLAAQAQPWPARPISYVVPFTPGGSTDIVGRTVAEILTKSLGQPVVVENKPGAAGAVGAAQVAKSKPDGYSMMGGTISTHAINAALYKNLAYDPVKDFEPVTLVGFVPNALFVNPSLPVNNVQEFIALLKKDESARTFASSGAGTSTHLAGELFADLLGIKVTHVPYKGSPQALQDVAGGSVPYTFDQLTAGLSLAKAGKLKLLAVTSPKRSAIAPDTPTMIEAGVKGFDSVSWQAVYVPKGTPKEIVQRLNRDIVAGLKTKDLRDKLASTLGMEVVGSTPEELAALMAVDIPRMADLVRKSGAKAE